MNLGVGWQPLVCWPLSLSCEFFLPHLAAARVAGTLNHICEGKQSMSAASPVTQQIRAFIIENFLYGQEREFNNDASFLEEGIVDSTGVLQLVAFLEETYGIKVEDEELTPQNLDSVNSVAAYLARKVNASVASSSRDVPEARA